jgi:hypothetical protein
MTTIISCLIVGFLAGLQVGEWRWRKAMHTLCTLTDMARARLEELKREPPV